MKYIKILLQISFFTLLGVLVFVIVSSRFSLFGLKSFTVMTGSMEPKVHVGSVVFTLPASAYKIGDILTFQRGNISVTHRIISSNENGTYIVKGDANKSPDPTPVVKSQIIGKDVLVIPYLGRFTAFLKTVPGFILFIGFPILVFILIEAFVIKKEWEKSIEKKVLERVQNQPFGFETL